MGPINSRAFFFTEWVKLKIFRYFKITDLFLFSVFISSIKNFNFFISINSVWFFLITLFLLHYVDVFL